MSRETEPGVTVTRNEQVGHSVKGRLTQPGPVSVMGSNLGNKGAKVGKRIDISGQPPVRGPSDAVPPQLAVRSPAGGTSRPVGERVHTQGYNRTSGGGPDPLPLLTPSETGRAAYGDAMRDFQEVTDFGTLKTYQKAAQER